MTNYGSNFDLIGQKHAFDTPIHQMFAELESKKQSDFKTFQEYNDWHNQIVQKYAHVFSAPMRENFLKQKASMPLPSQPKGQNNP